MPRQPQQSYCRDQLAGGDINAVSNFELKDAISSQFGLSNAANETSLAVNELQQAIDQLENRDINSISSSELQQALLTEFWFRSNA